MTTHVTRAARIGLGPQLIVVVLVLGLAVAMALEPTRQLLEQRSRISEMSADLHRTEKSNEKLANRIMKLNDPVFLEQKAREQSGLVKPGEISVVVLPPVEKSTEQKDRRPAPVVEPDAGFFDSMKSFLGLN
ncbi:MAG: septum formation initiator family protein [Actinomycetota bacterium]|nr:septum formation initiator family protein [Actinomycetota bacterium]